MPVGNANVSEWPCPCKASGQNFRSDGKHQATLGHCCHYVLLFVFLFFFISVCANRTGSNDEPPRPALSRAREVPMILSLCICYGLSLFFIFRRFLLQKSNIFSVFCIPPVEYDSLYSGTDREKGAKVLRTCFLQLVIHRAVDCNTQYGITECGPNSSRWYTDKENVFR